MPPQILTCEQRSDEWYQARLGMATASQIAALITPKTFKVASNTTSRELVTRLAAERISGRVEPTHTTASMWRGIEEEPLAREAYEAHTGQAVEQVGFMIRDDDGVRIGYSPDGLVGDDGLIEIKSRTNRIQVESVLDGINGFTMAQLQCGLYVSERSWLDYVSYSGGLHLWIDRVYPGDPWQAVIREAAEKLEHDIAAITARYMERVNGLPIMPVTPDYSEIEV